jgi:hypothetical protein
LNLSHAPDCNAVGIALHHVHIVLDKNRGHLFLRESILLLRWP